MCCIPILRAGATGGVFGSSTSGMSTCDAGDSGGGDAKTSLSTGAEAGGLAVADADAGGLAVAGVEAGGEEVGVGVRSIFRRFGAFSFSSSSPPSSRSCLRPDDLAGVDGCVVVCEDELKLGAAGTKGRGGDVCAAARIDDGGGGCGEDGVDPGGIDPGGTCTSRSGDVTVVEAAGGVNGFLVGAAPHVHLSMNCHVYLVSTVDAIPQGLIRTDLRHIRKLLIQMYAHSSLVLKIDHACIHPRYHPIGQYRVRDVHCLSSFCVV